MKSQKKMKRRPMKRSERLMLKPTRKRARRSTFLAHTTRRKMRKLTLKQILWLRIENPRERAPFLLRVALRDPEVKVAQDPLIAAESLGHLEKITVAAQ